MKVSFDFDGTLHNKKVRLLAKTLCKAGEEVWIVTSRSKDNVNDDLFELCDEVGINKSKVVFTNGMIKADVFFKEDFDVHFDDGWDEVLEITKRGGTAFLVDADFEEIYMEMQYQSSQRKNR